MFQIRPDNPDNMPQKPTQITTRNNEAALMRFPDDVPDSLSWWAEQYFRHEVTTSQASQKVQRRDLDLSCGSWWPKRKPATSRRFSASLDTGRRLQYAVRQSDTGGAGRSVEREINVQLPICPVMRPFKVSTITCCPVSIANFVADSKKDFNLPTRGCGRWISSSMPSMTSIASMRFPSGSD